MLGLDRISKIIIVTPIPFNQRDYNRFGVGTFIEHGYETEIWNVSAIIYNGQPPVEHLTGTALPHLSIIIDSLDEIDRRLKMAQNTLMVLFLPYDVSSYGILSLISKYKIPYFVDVANALPLIPFISSKLVGQVSARRLKNMIFSRLPHQMLGIKKPEVIIAGGLKSMDNCRWPLNKQTVVLPVHTHDYDLYLEERKKGNSEGGKIGVFLDQYLPFHPDYKFSEIRVNISPDKYYSSLNRLFSFLENEHKCEIIIAAHPRSDYDSHDWFEGRSVVRGSTSDLVRRSAVTIAHYTTAIYMAMLFGKPIVFVTTDELNQSVLGAYISHLASLAGSKAINIDHSYEIEQEMELGVDSSHYDAFINNYIKIKGTEEKPFWEIVAGFISSAATKKGP